MGYARAQLMNIVRLRQHNNNYQSVLHQSNRFSCPGRSDGQTDRLRIEMSLSGGHCRIGGAASLDLSRGLDSEETQRLQESQPNYVHLDVIDG